MTDELEHSCPCSKFNVGNKGLFRNMVVVFFAQKSMIQTKEQNAGGQNIKSRKKDTSSFGNFDSLLTEA